MPWRLLRAILDRRSMIPAPYMYVGALAVGAAVGGALDLWLGWPWWSVALAFLSAVWLVFLSSAFFGPWPGRELRLEILDAVAPRGSVQRRRREEQRIFRVCPFPFFGLDASWRGIRMLGGYQIKSAKDIASIELIHGDMSTSGTRVRVQTAPVTYEGRHTLQNAALELWQSSERPPADLSPQLKGAWMHRRFEESRSRQASWTKVPIMVNGTFIDFDWLDAGDRWVARAGLGELIVRVNGNQFPVESVRLVTIADVEPYIEGSRRYEDEQRRQHKE